MMIYSYVLTFALLAAVMTNACQYFYLHPPRKPGFWSQTAPFYMMVISTVLLLLAPLKNLLVNICMASFKQNGFDSTIEHTLDVAYMPEFGTVHMQVYTALAYVLMMVATALQMEFYEKIQAMRTTTDTNKKACSSSGG